MPVASSGNDVLYRKVSVKDFGARGDGVTLDTVTNCRIDTSDDCITLRASGAHLLEDPHDCANVSVSDCELSSSCNAIRVGVGEGHIHDAVLSNLTLTDTNTAFNIVASYGGGARGTDIDNILFKDINSKMKQSFFTD